MPGGHQPVANGDCTVWAVLDGQIYNHPELRERLRAEGHDFATGTDTEVLVHAYERYGEDLVHHLDGMFAFAIWDARRGRLVVARDRFGEKPLYYTDRGGQLTFASELTALCGATPGRWEARRSTRRSCGTSRPNSVSMVGSTSEDSRKDDIARELAGLDVAVHASVIPEPFGLVVVEAMAMGVPVVAADAGGPAEVIRHGVSGLLYPPGDVHALAALLKGLAADRELRERLAAAGHDQAREYSPEAVAAQVRAVYEVALG